MERPKHEPFKLPWHMQQEVNPVEKHIAAAECICRKEAVRVLNNQPEAFRQEMEKLLLQVLSAGIEKGLITKQKIDSL